MFFGYLEDCIVRINEITYQIIFDVLALEIEKWKLGVYPLYHGQSNIFEVVDNIQKERDLGLSNREDITKYLSDNCDEDEFISSNVQSVNYSLFGNFGSTGESSLFYFLFNRSQISVEHLCSRLKIKEFDKIEIDNYKNNNMCKNGRIIMYYIRLDKINEYVIDTESGGTPTHDIPSNIVMKCCDERSTLLEINTRQARMINFQQLEHSKFSENSFRAMKNII